MSGMHCRRAASRITLRALGVPSKVMNYSRRTLARGAALGKKNSTSAGELLLPLPGKRRESLVKEEMRVDPEIRILADGAAIAKRAAQEFIQAAAAAVRERGAFHVALAGGSTPKALYELLANDPTLR